MAQASSAGFAAYGEFERQGYSRVARSYSGDTARVTAQVNERILDAVGAARGMQVLDVACGPGRLSAAAIARGCRVTGIDFAEPMVEIARAANPSGIFQVGNAMALPLADESFDRVVCSLGILHFIDPEQAIREARRVLRAGGTYAITCWAPPPRNPFMALLFGAVQQHGTTDVPLPPGPPLFRFGDPAECERTLRACGMQDVRTCDLPMDWDFPSPEDVVPSVLGATARLSPMLALQTPEARQRIEAAITEGARKYLSGDKVAIPAPMVLAVSRKG